MNRRWELLDSGRVSDITKSKKRFEDLVAFHWRYYSELAFQRKQIREELNSALREVATPFDFTRWQRVVKFKHSLDPLSAKGSLADPGGRFNVGAIDPTRYPMFSALYLAADKGTALAEVLGRGVTNNLLTPEELALTKPDSISVLSVSGRVEALLDVRLHSNLQRFVALIKDFKISRALRLEAQTLGAPLELVRTVEAMQKGLGYANWRDWPMHYDVPAAGQIFGSIALDAGIEGILYESAITGKECLAVFPQNFLNSSAFIELDDQVPSQEIPRRMDSTNFKQFI
jgi:hypothetical protein